MSTPGDDEPTAHSIGACADGVCRQTRVVTRVRSADGAAELKTEIKFVCAKTPDNTRPPEPRVDLTQLAECRKRAAESDADAAECERGRDGAHAVSG